MRKKNWSNILSVLARTTLAFVFVFGQTAWAMQGQNGKDKPGLSTGVKSQEAQANLPASTAAKTQSAEEETTAAENPSAQENTHPGGQHEGIKVHGHWTIEVRNPDGSLATHREFENSYDPNTTLLPSILSRTNSVGYWQVVLTTTSQLSGQAGPQPPCGLTGGAPCTVLEGACYSDNFFSCTLTVTQSTRTIILSGNFIAPNTGAINYVSTQNYLCPNTTTTPPLPPCPETTATNFTMFTFPSSMPPVTVSAGQTIAVTVNISFS